MKLFASLLLAGAVAMLCRDASAQLVYSPNLTGYVNVQGVLHENGAPVNGFMDWCWVVWAAPSGGTRLATDTNMNNNVLVSNGVANVLLNVGDLAMLGLSPTQELWLELDLRPSGTSNAFTVLSPRQRIVPSLFATMAVRAEEARRLIEPLSANLMPAVISNLTFTGRPVFGGSTSGPPFVVTSRQTVANLMAECADYALDAYTLDGYDSSEFWKLEGNAGTIAGTDFLGTTDNQALELKVNSARAMRFEPATSPNLIGGSSANAVTPGVMGATIGGGGLGGLGGGTPNNVRANYSTISGGRGNLIRENSIESIIGGGVLNFVGPSALSATIAGGQSNSVSQSAATIGGGLRNTNAAQAGTIGGGATNLIDSSSLLATIGGGNGNQTVSAPYGTIPGGKEARANDYGQMAYASGKFSSAGDAQSSTFVLRGTSPADEAGETELFLDGIGERMHIRTTGAWMFDILVVSHSANGHTRGFQILGLIENTGVTTLAGAPTVTKFNYSGAVSADARVEAGNPDASLRILVHKSLSSTETRWVATVRTAEVLFPAN